MVILPPNRTGNPLIVTAGFCHHRRSASFDLTDLIVGIGNIASLLLVEENFSGQIFMALFSQYKHYKITFSQNKSKIAKCFAR